MGHDLTSQNEDRKTKAIICKTKNMEEFEFALEDQANRRK